MTPLRALLLAPILAAAAPSAFAQAAEDPLRVQVGRYITLAPTTALEQRLPLLAAIDVRLPQRIAWLRTALQYVLRDTGYELAPDAQHCPEIRAIFERKVIAASQRRFDRVTVLAILHALAGPAFVIQIDPVARLIAFGLAPAFVSASKTVVPAPDSVRAAPPPPAASQKKRTAQPAPADPDPANTPDPGDSGTRALSLVSEFRSAPAAPVPDNPVSDNPDSGNPETAGVKKTKTVVKKFVIANPFAEKPLVEQPAAIAKAYTPGHPPFRPVWEQ